MVKKEFIDLNDVFPEVEFTDLFISHYSKRLKSGDWKPDISPEYRGNWKNTSGKGKRIKIGTVRDFSKRYGL